MVVALGGVHQPEVGGGGVQAVFGKTWQWVCHVEKLRDQGSYVSATVAGMPIVIVRGKDGQLRAFYNVCKHRAHELLQGSGTTRNIVCPYHAWTYSLDGSLKAARRADKMEDFDKSEVCLDQVQVEEFGGMVYVNLDPTAQALGEQAPDLAEEIAFWAPDVAGLTHAKRFGYDVNTNWKNVIDNFLECYHCHIAHKEFVELVDMDTYEVKTHGIWSSHFAEAGKHENAAYDVSGATVKDARRVVAVAEHLSAAVPGRGNFMVFQVVPRARPNAGDLGLLLRDHRARTGRGRVGAYVDDVLQVRTSTSSRASSAAWHPGVRPGPDRLRPRRLGALRARRAPLPWPGARRLPRASAPTAATGG